MAWDTAELARRFARPENKDLLTYLQHRGPSAHSNLGMLLYAAAPTLPGTAVFGPNPTACSYVFLHTHEGVAFAVALGMRSLVLRLPDAARAPAHAAGARAFPELSADWLVLDPFAAGRTKAQAAALVRRLLKAAHAHARDLAQG